MKGWNSRISVALTLLVGAAVPAAVPAQVRTAVPLIPLERFFDNPEIAGAQISPDGRWLSYVKPYKGKLNVYVRPVNGTQADERVMTTDTLRPVGQYFWSRDARYILYVQDKGGNENFRIYAVDPTQQGIPVARDLTPFDKVRAEIFEVPRRSPGKILIGLNKRIPSAFDAYWLDLASGRLDLAVENPGRHGSYLIDNSGQIRVATQSTATGANEILVRAKGGDPWRTLMTTPASEDVTPLRIAPDGKHLYVASNVGAFECDPGFVRGSRRPQGSRISHPPRATSKRKTCRWCCSFTGDHGREIIGDISPRRNSSPLADTGFSRSFIAARQDTARVMARYAVIHASYPPGVINL